CRSRRIAPPEVAGGAKPACFGRCTMSLTVSSPQLAVAAELRRYLRRIQIQPWLHLLPVIAGLGLWVFWPLLRAFVLSFYEWNLLPTSPQRFVGLQNYLRLVALPEMRNALVNTVIYIVGLLPMSVILPLGIAIFTQDLPGRARNIYRALI